MSVVFSPGKHATAVTGDAVAPARASDRPHRAARRARRRAAAWIDRAWRTVGQVVLFMGFGLLGLFYIAVVVPWVLLSCPDRQGRREAARDWSYRLLKLTIDAGCALRLITLDARDLDRVPTGALIVANLPTLIDAFFFMGRVRGVVPIAKRALLGNWTVGPAIRLSDYVINDAGLAMVEDCVTRLDAGETLLVFPEGTRTVAGQPLALRRGAAQIAVRARRAPVPVTIRATGSLLAKGGRWWLAPAQRPSFTLVAHPPVDIEPFLAAGSTAVAARQLTDHLQQFFARELARSGAA
jgi:1-acyl-sn-glycerol-3-phosphate acyltransferase